MGGLSIGALGALAAAAVAMAAMAAGTVWLANRGRSGPGGRASAAQQMTCSVCQRALMFHESELKDLEGSECALVIREKPELVGAKLAEYICPHCEAAHCFVRDGKKIRWVAANLYEPQNSGVRCMECLKPLRPSPWAPGTYDGRLDQVPDPAGNYGFVCSLCWAVCCATCCQRLSHGTSEQGIWVCPRCARRSVDALYSPQIHTIAQGTSRRRPGL